MALRRLRNASEQLDEEDRVIDLCIALEALFMDDGELKKQFKLIARRGSWHFADYQPQPGARYVLVTPRVGS